MADVSRMGAVSRCADEPVRPQSCRFKPQIVEHSLSLSAPKAAATALTGQLLRGQEALAALRPQWQAALERMAAPSVFLGPTYIAATLRHLSEPGDEPWFVVVHRGQELVGLLPLLRRRARLLGWPIHRLEHAGTVSGDRPGIVCLGDPGEIWQAMLAVLLQHRREWQQADLRELDEPCPLLSDAFWAAQAGWSRARREQALWTYAGWLPLEGHWEQYMATRSRNARQGYRRREKLLYEAHPDTHIEVVDRPEAIGPAFERYLAVEVRGWKGCEGVGLWSDPRQQDLYREVLPELARHGQAAVWLLRSGGRDIAALVRLRQGGTLYERHSAYDPDYARFSPSTYLCMEAVRRSFGSGCRESDVLGMPEPLESRPAIYPWYPHTRRTWRLRLTLLPLHLEPLQWLQALRTRLSERRRQSGPADATAAPCPPSPNPDAATAAPAPTPKP